MDYHKIYSRIYRVLFSGIWIETIDLYDLLILFECESGSNLEAVGRQGIQVMGKIETLYIK